MGRCPMLGHCALSGRYPLFQFWTALKGQNTIAPGIARGIHREYARHGNLQSLHYICKSTTYVATPITWSMRRCPMLGHCALSGRFPLFQFWTALKGQNTIAPGIARGIHREYARQGILQSLHYICKSTTYVAMPITWTMWRCPMLGHCALSGRYPLFLFWTALKGQNTIASGITRGIHREYARDGNLQSFHYICKPTTTPYGTISRKKLYTYRF